MVVWGGLTNSWEKKRSKREGEKERYTHLNAEFQRIARRDKKAFLSNQCKEIEENNRIRKTRDLFKKTGDTKGTFHAKMGSIKDRNGMDLTEADGWMASPTQWTRVWANSGSWWWTGRPGVLRFMGSQRVRHNWETELNWTWQKYKAIIGAPSRISWNFPGWRKEDRTYISSYSIHTERKVIRILIIKERVKLEE